MHQNTTFEGLFPSLVTLEVFVYNKYPEYTRLDGVVGEEPSWFSKESQSFLLSTKLTLHTEE